MRKNGLEKNIAIKILSKLKQKKHVTKPIVYLNKLNQLYMVSCCYFFDE